jgi:cell division protein FtsX
VSRHLKILEYALASLASRRGKSLAVVAVFALTVGILSSILLVTRALQEETTRLLLGAPELLVQRIMAGRHDLIPRSYAEPIRAMAGVGGVQPRHWGYYYDALTGANYTVLGVAGTAGELELLEGRLPEGPGECAVGAGVARLRGTETGGDLILIDSENLGTVFQVVGVFRAASNLLTHDLIVLTDEDVQAFFGFPEGAATDLAIRVRNPSEVDTVARKIKQALPDTRPITRGEVLRTYEAVLHWRSGMMLAVFGAALIAFCVLAWDKATGLSAEEKAEIGVLKAVGWETGDVLALKFWEGVVLSLTSFLLGFTLAYVHVFHLGAFALGPILKGWSVLFPDFSLPPYVDLYQATVVGFLTVVPYVAATVIPCWRAATTDPETVMRS